MTVILEKLSRDLGKYLNFAVYLLKKGRHRS